MTYLAVGLFAVAVGLMILDFIGFTPGAAGLSNMALVGAFVCLGVKGLSSLHHQWRQAHPLARH